MEASRSRGAPDAVNLDDPELEPLLRLSYVEGVGPRRISSLIDTFGSASEVLRKPTAVLRRVRGVGPQIAARIRSGASPALARKAAAAIEILHRHAAKVLLPSEPAYPAAFKRLPEAPFLIFAIGKLSLLDQPSVAIVGTRNPTGYGRDVSASLARQLTGHGICIVSGMARGIDREAHVGAIRARGATIAVLGHGIEQIYPPENARLVDAVRRNGLVLTEFPPFEKPLAGNFPRRNRLIAALSRAVVVVEMGMRSGAMHTVDFALEQGVEVMAVPGPIGIPASQGTNRLIREGASVVTSAQDILEEVFGFGGGSVSDTRPGLEQQGEAPPVDPLSTTSRRLLEGLPASAVHIDSIASLTRVTSAEAMQLLLDLEIRGLVAAEGGMRFRRIAG